jgi:hypothetical protein
LNIAAVMDAHGLLPSFAGIAPMFAPKEPFSRTDVRDMNSISVLWEKRVWKVVRKGGLEPPRPCGHQLLRLARLPLRHFRVGSSLVEQVGVEERDDAAAGVLDGWVVALGAHEASG